MDVCVCVLRGGGFVAKNVVPVKISRTGVFDYRQQQQLAVCVAEGPEEHQALLDAVAARVYFCPERYASPDTG